MFLKNPGFDKELPCLGARVVLLAHGGRRIAVAANELLDGLCHSGRLSAGESSSQRGLLNVGFPKTQRLEHMSGGNNVAAAFWRLIALPFGETVRDLRQPRYIAASQCAATPSSSGSAQSLVSGPSSAEMMPSK